MQLIDVKWCCPCPTRTMVSKSGISVIDNEARELSHICMPMSWVLRQSHQHQLLQCLISWLQKVISCSALQCHHASLWVSQSKEIHVLDQPTYTHTHSPTFTPPPVYPSPRHLSTHKHTPTHHPLNPITPHPSTTHPPAHTHTDLLLTDPDLHQPPPSLPSLPFPNKHTHW